jgi:hypothetical protein
VMTWMSQVRSVGKSVPGCEAKRGFSQSSSNG